MSTQLGNTKRTLGTGDLVISVSEIFDKLQGTVDAGTLEQLLRDIISDRRPQVRPGELITAELINQILAELESLATRVTKLEAGVVTPPAPAAVVITQVPSSVRLDHVLEIQGLNFGFSKGAHRVTVDGVIQNEFGTDSRDDFLSVTIRNITNVTEAGKPVQLVVSNGVQPPATRNLTILPSQVLGGSVDFIIGDPVPATIVGGSSTPVNFNCQLTSQASLRTTFTLTADISGVTNKVDWMSRLRLLTTAGEPITASTFDLAPRESRSFMVRLISIPTAAPQSKFTLGLTAASGAAGGVAAREFTIGENAPEDIANIPILQWVRIAGGSVNDARDTISVAAGQEATITLRAEFATGGTYTATLVPSAGTNNWAPAFNSPVPTPGGPQTSGDYSITIPASGAHVPKNPEFVVTPTSSATTPGSLTLRINKSGSTIFRTMKFTLLRT